MIFHAHRDRHAGKAVFVLEDWPDLLELFRRTGEKNNVRVIGAMTNHSARKLLDEIDIYHDLKMAFIDVEIGTECGLDVFHEIRSAAPKLPVVIMTGRPHYDTLVELIARDPYASFLSKPFFMEEITELFHDPCRRAGDIRELVELSQFIQETKLL